MTTWPNLTSWLLGGQGVAPWVHGGIPLYQTSPYCGLCKPMGDKAPAHSALPSLQNLGKVLKHLTISPPFSRSLGYSNGNICSWLRLIFYWQHLFLLRLIFCWWHLFLARTLGTNLCGEIMMIDGFSESFYWGLMTYFTRLIGMGDLDNAQRKPSWPDPYLTHCLYLRLLPLKLLLQLVSSSQH